MKTVAFLMMLVGALGYVLAPTRDVLAGSILLVWAGIGIALLRFLLREANRK